MIFKDFQQNLVKARKYLDQILTSTRRSSALRCLAAAWAGKSQDLKLKKVAGIHAVAFVATQATAAGKQLGKRDRPGDTAILVRRGRITSRVDGSRGVRAPVAGEEHREGDGDSARSQQDLPQPRVLPAAPGAGAAVPVQRP